MLNPTRLEHFRNLISLSVADGKIEATERVALSKIAFEWDIRCPTDPIDEFQVLAT